MELVWQGSHKSIFNLVFLSLSLSFFFPDPNLIETTLVWTGPDYFLVQIPHTKQFNPIHLKHDLEVSKRYANHKPVSTCFRVYLSTSLHWEAVHLPDPFKSKTWSRRLWLNLAEPEKPDAYRPCLSHVIHLILVHAKIYVSRYLTSALGRVVAWTMTNH